MADYSYNELMAMQNDAIRRVEDMRKRARQTAGIEDNPPKPIPAEKPRRVPQPNGYLQKPKNENDTIPLPHHKNAVVGNDFIENIRQGFNNLDIDSDKALILSLVLLLSHEQGNEELLTALIYMLT